MRLKSLVLFLVIALLLGACSVLAGIAHPNSPSTAYPPAERSTSQPPVSRYPPPVTSPTSPVTAFPEYAPQPEDASLQRDQAFLDLSSSQLVVIFGTPVKAEAILIGTLPDPCHALRVAVSPPDANKLINLDVYSVVDPAKLCAAVLSPYTATIQLGSFSQGDYSVTVNGLLLGKFSTAFSPQPGDRRLTRGEVTLEMDQSKLITLSDLTGQEAVFIQGSLPDPCHQLRVVLNPLIAHNSIRLEVYSVYDPQAMCTMVIVPFQLIIPLDVDLSGQYSVFINEQLLGKFKK